MTNTHENNYSAIFSCYPAYIIQSLKFCSQYKVHVYIHLGTRCRPKAYKYLKKFLQQLPFVLSVHSISKLNRLDWDQPKWNQPVKMWRNFTRDHIIDGTKLQDARWLAFNRIKGSPDTWLFQAYEPCLSKASTQ